MILAGDPGKKTGLASYAAGQLRTATIDGDDLDTIIAVMGDFARVTGGRGIVVVEDQYAAMHGGGKGKGRGRINVKAVLKLVERRCSLVVSARALGLRVELVFPATWQGAAFKSVARFDDAGRELDTKARAALFVQQRVHTVSRGAIPGTGQIERAVPSNKLPKDEADAGAIALYWATWRGGG